MIGSTGQRWWLSYFYKELEGTLSNDDSQIFYRFNQSGFHNFNSASLSISGDNSWENFWQEVDSYPPDKQQLTTVAANLS